MHTFRHTAVLLGLTLAAVEAQTASSRMATAANSFLATLDEKQKQKVLAAYDDEEQRKRWSNFPTGFVPRGGVSLKDMTTEQRTAAMALMATVLSQRGFEKTQQIMAGDETLKSNPGPGPGGNGGGPRGGDGKQGRRGGGPGSGAMFGRTCTTFPSWARRRTKSRGCCNSGGITWH